MPVHPRPLILVRGFGFFDVEDEQRNAYQGFNDGTVYPDRRGESYIYEGFVLRALKSRQYLYSDATNVVAYYGRDVQVRDLPDPLPSHAGRIVLDPDVAKERLENGVGGTIWVYRYYDLLPRSIRNYASGLVRLIELIEEATTEHPGPRADRWRGVDIVAHSMGGLIVNEALRLMHTAEKGSANTQVNKVVTLGTPHRGIRFQSVPPGLLHALSSTYEKFDDLRRMLPGGDAEVSQGTRDALDELAAFDHDNLRYLDVGADPSQQETTFQADRVLTVVGTDFRSYGNKAASFLNQVTNMADGGGVAGNHSDGLVMQSAAQLPGSPRTFIHKCHGGRDSLVTSREAYEIAMRFLHGTHRIALRLQEAQITQGGDWGPFGRNEFYLGVSVKPRGVDFNLFQQSMAAQNCYGPFDSKTLDEGDDVRDALTQPLTDWDYQKPYWAGAGRLLWEGWIDAANLFNQASNGAIFRLDVFVGEDDPGGFSDKVIFRKQLFAQVFPGERPTLFVHSGEHYLDPTQYPTLASVEAIAEKPSSQGLTVAVQKARPCPGVGDGARNGWDFVTNGTGFTGTFHVEIEETDDPARLAD